MFVPEFMRTAHFLFFLRFLKYPFFCLAIGARTGVGREANTVFGNLRRWLNSMTPHKSHQNIVNI